MDSRICCRLVRRHVHTVLYEGMKGIYRMRRIYRVNGESGLGLGLHDAARCLASGALALLPTETVYGVGVAVAPFAGTDAMPGSDSGYRRIFSLKQRELTQTVPWLVADASALDEYGANVSDAARALAKAFWPGALTIVVQAAPCVPTFMQAHDGTVALRASACPTIQQLVRACASPLAVTSANTHGAPAPASFAQAEPRIIEGVDIAIDAGTTCCRQASTIVSCAGSQPVLIREGAITADDLQRALDAAHLDSQLQKGC